MKNGILIAIGAGLLALGAGGGYMMQPKPPKPELPKKMELWVSENRDPDEVIAGLEDQVTTLTRERDDKTGELTKAEQKMAGMVAKGELMAALKAKDTAEGEVVSLGKKLETAEGTVMNLTKAKDTAEATVMMVTKAKEGVEKKLGEVEGNLKTIAKAKETAEGKIVEVEKAKATVEGQLLEVEKGKKTAEDKVMELTKKVADTEEARAALARAKDDVQGKLAMAEVTVKSLTKAKGEAEAVAKTNLDLFKEAVTKAVTTKELKAKDVSAVAVSKDGKYLAYGTKAGDVYVWIVDGTEAPNQYKGGLKAPVTAVGVNDGIVAAAAGKSVVAWKQAEPNKAIPNPDAKEDIRRIVVSGGSLELHKDVDKTVLPTLPDFLKTEWALEAKDASITYSSSDRLLVTTTTEGITYRRLPAWLPK